MLAEALVGDAAATLEAWNGIFTTDLATGAVVKAASTSATEFTVIRVKGRISASATGQLIPQFQYSAAPGGAPTIKDGTYFKIKALSEGVTGSRTDI
jgi:hypothetical protein